MTKRLYYDDSHLTEFTAHIVERVQIGEQPAVVLDRTAFYPTGGGQPHDTGEVGGVQVVDVLTREADGEVLHVLAGAPPAADEVACRVDCARRFDFMQQHTGQHILTQAFVQTAGIQTVGFHLTEDTLTIDLDRADIPQDVLDEAEDVANRIIYEDRPVVALLVDPDDTDGVRMRKRPDHLHTDGLRVIEVEGFDTTACGGTHVNRTGALGMIKILKVESVREGSRLSFVCGWRALRDYREKHAMLEALSNELTTGYWEVGDAVERLRADLKETQRALKSASREMVGYQAARLLAEAEPFGEARLIHAVFEDRDPGEVRALVSELVKDPGVIVLAGIPGETTQLIFARSDDLPHNMNGPLQAAFEVLGGGRGGGRPAFCQGGGAAASAEQVAGALQAAVQVLD